MINIVPYNEDLAEHFRDLNLQWLERYFRVEPKDKMLLEDSKKEIIDKGGYIFFGANNGTIVGCFALIKISETIFELGKMAVDPNYQGQMIGQRLLDHAILHCRKNNVEKLILYSHTKLCSAIHIYKKIGFMEVPLEPFTPYERSNIKMELYLN